MPRDVPIPEQKELQTRISGWFKERTPADARYQGAGPFRFVAARQLQYMDRTDVGSVMFEQSQYGIGDSALDSLSPASSVLLPRLDSAVDATGLKVIGRRFVTFESEYVGAAEPARLPAGFDPRTASRLVARTAEYERFVDSLPVFGSELLVGLMPDGRIGRFRLHWPPIDARLIKEAMKLRDAVDRKSWTLPDSMRAADIEVLEVKAGVGHSGIADPRFRAGAVVRVLYRKTAVDRDIRATSTGYKYFDAHGKELLLDMFPALAPTPVGEKVAGPKR